MTPMASGTMTLVLSEALGTLIAGFAGLGAAAWPAGSLTGVSSRVAVGLAGADWLANLLPHLGQKAMPSGDLLSALGAEHGASFRWEP